MFAIDNIPPALLSQLMIILEKHRAAVANGVAVVDVRGDNLLDDFPAAVTALKSQVRGSVSFSGCLGRSTSYRFEATRRRHPFHGEGSFWTELPGRETASSPSSNCLTRF